MGEASLAEPYDIVIIGAGPAGSSAAKTAAERGAKVLFIDRRQRVGVPVQCAEFVPQWISRHAHFSPTCIHQTIDSMVTHLPDGASYEMKSPGYMLDRSLFDKELVASAVLAGAKISIETRAVSLLAEGLAVERGPEKAIIRSKIFIGADGVHSAIARFVGQPSLKTLVALQYEVVMPKPQNHVEVFFHKDFEGGYAWFFPKGSTANVGVGVVASKTAQLPSLLGDFLNLLRKSKKWVSAEIVSKTGGSIPCEPYRRTFFDNILLLGDAAGHAHPITGAGIFNAAMDGEIAGKIAAEAVVRGDLHYLKNYEIEWQEAFGKILSYAALKREFLEAHWNQPGVDFEGLIRKTWVGFKEYHADRRKIALRPPLPTGGNVPLR